MLRERVVAVVRPLVVAGEPVQLSRRGVLNLVADGALLVLLLVVAVVTLVVRMAVCCSVANVGGQRRGEVVCS